MFFRQFANGTPDKVAIHMTPSGHELTYGELEARSNRLAHYLHDLGMARGDHFAIFMENNLAYAECCAAGERAGFYYTCVNSFLTSSELAYILENCEAQVLITSQAKREIALEAMRACPRIERCLVVDGPGDGGRVLNLAEAVRDCPSSPLADEALGVAMLYSSGTTGRPKGILRPLPPVTPDHQIAIHEFLQKLWRFREGMVYLSPAPLYHSAPQASINIALRNGGTVIVMERFDAMEYLRLVERFRVTHSQVVPTMFSRLLKLPQTERDSIDISSLETVIHAAAPCPPQVKQQMIEWFGPIIYEYYGATEGLGYAGCDTSEWLAHRGTVGRVMLGELQVLADEMKPVPNGTSGTLWFKAASAFEYFNDPERTKEARSPDGTMSTVGDVGYVDDDGFLYLTDRSTFMIVSGGVNIYPQECENLLITHPKVADAAVFGVPNEDLGEEVKAVVQPVPGIEVGPDLARELTEFCAQHLSRQKLPRTIDFDAELPRLPTGKLYKRVLRDRYWGDRKSRIV